jgi:hypothetical protein
MITHVAAAGEGRGRVVLWLGSAAQSSLTAVEVAMLLARAYQAEVESVYVEDPQLLDLADLPFARAISSDADGWQALPRDNLEREIRFLGAALQRQVAEVAQRYDIPLRSSVMRDEPMHAVAHACAENGPWNVVSMAEPFGPGDEPRLARIFAEVTDTTGVVIVGPQARRTQGTVIAAIEQVERLDPMLNAAERFAGVTGGDVKLFLVGNQPDALSWLDGEVRLVLGERAGPAIETVLTTRADLAPLVEAVRRHKGGFLLAQYGGQVVTAETSLRPLASALECPLLLVR